MRHYHLFILDDADDDDDDDDDGGDDKGEDSGLVNGQELTDRLIELGLRRYTRKSCLRVYLHTCICTHFTVHVWAGEGHWGGGDITWGVGDCSLFDAFVGFWRFRDISLLDGNHLKYWTNSLDSNWTVGSRVNKDVSEAYLVARLATDL